MSTSAAETWFVVVRDSDDPEGAGTIVAVGWTRQRAGTFGDHYVPQPFIYDASAPGPRPPGCAGWCGLAPPQVDQRVWYTGSKCRPIDRLADEAAFRVIVGNFDAVFGTEEGA